MVGVCFKSGAPLHRGFGNTPCLGGIPAQGATDSVDAGRLCACASPPKRRSYPCMASAAFLLSSASLN